MRTLGRAPRETEFEVIGPLDAEDLALLEVEGRPAGQPEPLKRVGDRHHALARALAGGMADGEAATAVGLTLNRVSILKGDPTFKALVDFYREKVDAAYVGLHDTLAGMSLDAALVLRERLEDEPDKLKVDQLLDIVKMGADRTGHGPSQKIEKNVNINLANRLEEARRRVRERIIDITPE